MVARWIPLASAGAAVVLVGVLATAVLAPRIAEVAEDGGAGSAADGGSGNSEGPRLTFAEQAPPPTRAAEPTGPGVIGLVDPDWVATTAAATRIPPQAVLAYAGAVLGAEEVFPGCGLGWNTLAGIGYAESDHGRHGGATFEPNGHVTPKIFGVPLDGTSTAHIPDTDGGQFDETADIDRAIGPMQLIPQTWASWPSDGNGDLVPDPHNIYDAAVASANYLCHATTSFVTEDGFRAGVAAYNTADSYLGIVATAAQRYLDETRAR